MAGPRILDELGQIAKGVEREFKEARRLLSFAEYLELFATDPVRHSRDAARYLRDVFDHYGKETVKRPWGEQVRYRLFDLPWRTAEEGRKDALVGQEAVQAGVYRVLANFVREGRPNRMILMHGPNGSAKSTIAACVMRALENYSSLAEGALYRFSWIFPSQTTLKGSIGFGGKQSSRDDEASYAHLPEDEVDSRLMVEVRDHPLFLLPQPERKRLLERMYAEAGAQERASDWILHGTLSHKSRQIYEALLTSYQGSLEEVLRHIQVERYFISRRYRVGAVTLGPQLSVDAEERQVTADRSLSALPSALQAMTLFEAHGELVDAAGGLLEFSDLLKRPLDAFKYLQITAETGEVQLRSQNLLVNCVLLASGNEAHLHAFHGHPEFESFRGRLEMVPSPYLRSYLDEQAIYDAQVAPQVGKHVAPHATQMAAQFAVMTRMRRPQVDRYEKPLANLVGELSAVEKADLYASGTTPERLEEEQAKLLRAAIPMLYVESDSYPIYEGSVGASPREMRSVLLDAAQNVRFRSLSPFAVLEQLDRLCDKKSEYAWLDEERQPGGYHDHELFRKELKRRLLDQLEDELRVASGLVDETRYVELFERYIMHVSYWVKGEKLQNPLTGAYEDPDTQLFEEIESKLGAPDRPETLRHGLISRIAAWAINHPDAPLDNAHVFATQLRRLREAVFAERRVHVAKLCRDVAVLLREEGSGLSEPQRRDARRVVERLATNFGYDESSAADAAAALVRERFAELLG